MSGCCEGNDVSCLNTTSGTTAVLLGTSRSMGPCDHEEADTRLLIHLQDAIQNSCTKCVVRTVDTDVVCLLGQISKFKKRNIEMQFKTLPMRNRFNRCHLTIIKKYSLINSALYLASYLLMYKYIYTSTYNM